MANLNMTMRLDDGSFVMLDMDLLDEDSKPLAQVIKEFIEQYPERINVPTVPSTMPTPAPTPSRDSNDLTLDPPAIDQPTGGN